MGKEKWQSGAESDFEPIVEEIKKEFASQNIYFDYIHAEPNDNLDSKGIDFKLFYKYYEIPVQLKSLFPKSQFKAKVEKHFKRYNIPMIFIGQKARPENIKFVTFDLLKEWENNPEKAKKLVYIVNGEVKKFYHKKEPQN